MTMPRLLGGRYELGETLGHGGMAEVHLGRDTRLGRDVAIKVLRHDLARDTGFQARFRREAQNAAALNHPSIVAVYDTGEELASDGLGLPYIVMEYVEGRTLREVLEAEGKLMPVRAMEIAADACAALEFSHRNGIVHRDIKPANVMLCPNGQVKVMDFGIARAVTQGSATMTQTSAVIGTAQYLSPEQARGETVDNRSDIYSTGCLLYELLVGEPPFTGDSPVSVAYQHVREDPTPPSERDPEIPPAADSVVLKAMAKNPANRYQSAGEMRADLVRAVAGRPVEATPVLTGSERTRVVSMPSAAAGSTLLRRPPEPNRRRRALAYIALALAVVGVFVLAAFLTKNITSNSSKVVVPNVVGKPQAEAESLLKQRKLKVSTKSAFSSDADKGKVVQQSPDSNTQLSPGSTVTLTIGQGTEKVPVPDLVGLSRDDAFSRLGSAKLKGVPKEVASTEPAGTVVSTSPVSGTQVPLNSTVTVNISDGSIVVPNVVGQTEDLARATLRDFTVFAVSQQSSSKPPGTVLSQDPAGGKLAKSGSKVTIIVATAPPTPTPTASPSPTPSATPTVITIP